MVIIGAGIGGLCMAIALRGMDVQVYEQAPEPRAAGAGLTLWANAVHALHRLGIQVEAHAVEVQSAIRRWDGLVLSQLDPQQAQARFGAPTLAVHRIDFMHALLEQVGDRVIYGKRMVRYEQDTDHIRAIFDDGSSASGAVLVGADGIGSVVRQQMHPGSLPVYRGYPAWRAVLPFDHSANKWGETWGKGARFGTVPLSQGRVYWFATANRPANTPPGDHRAELKRLFGQWHEPIPQLIAATPDEAMLYNDISDIEPLNSWVDGRAVLLGDAAHAMTPNMGQGACQAIEDALALADALQSQSSLAGALSAYENRRVAHTRRVVLRSRSIGRMGQLDSSLAVMLRDGMTRLIPSQMTLRGLDFVLKPD